ELFKSLPSGIQEQLKNLNPDSAFSVKQLYLDLNLPPLQDEPEIVGLDKDSDAYVALQKGFVGLYWSELKKSGDVILGYTVIPKVHRPNPKAPSVVPTAMEKEVSPYRDSSGQPMPSNRGLYTLDYLVMSDHRTLPPSRQFGWNWIDDTERTKAHGVVAVRKERFVDFLNKVLGAELKSICFKPWVRCTAEGLKVYY